MTKKNIIVDEYHQSASAQAHRKRGDQISDAISEIRTNNNGIAAVQALGGWIFATLSDEEMVTLNFYRDTGRKSGVSISIDNGVDKDKLARAVSREQADQILKRANNRVHVLIAG